MLYSISNEDLLTKEKGKLKRRRILTIVSIAVLTLLVVSIVASPLSMLATAESEIELAYDDGSFETFWGVTHGCKHAVRFSLPEGWTGALVTKARFYMGDKNLAFKVHIYGNDGTTELVTPFDVTPSATGWFDVDLSTLAICVSEDFYIAKEQILSGGPPYLGEDRNAPLAGRTCFMAEGGTSWIIIWDVNLGIRAVVAEQNPPEASFVATPETADVGQTITFNASASTPGCNDTHTMPITEYRWNFGDGNEITTPTPMVYHSYSDPEIYYPTLTVYAPGATPETDSTTRNVTITDNWPMFHHDLTHSGYTDSKAPSTNSTIWNYTAGWLLSSPSVYQGLVYFGGGQDVLALDAHTGLLKWSYKTDTSVSSSPFVSEDRLYIGNDNGWIYCLNATTGTHIWDSWIGGNIFACPTVAYGRVYVGGLTSGGENFYCLNATTGEWLWQIGLFTYIGIYSSAAVLDNRVYVATAEGSVYCLNTTTGDEIWSYAANIGGASSPAIADGRLYIGGDRVYCLNATNGVLIWNNTETMGCYDSSPAIAYGKIYIGSLIDYNVYCLNATTGEHIWNYGTGYQISSSPAVADGKVYVGSYDNKFYCLNATTGECIWSYTTGFWIISSPAITYGRVYVGSMDGKMYAFGEIRDIAIADVATSKTGCLPKPTVGQGKIATINTTVENRGEYTETFSVTIYADSTQIGLRQVTLSQGENTTLSFAWDTTGFTYGNHSLRAEIGIIPFETDTGNNVMESWIIITIPGDIDGNYNVQLADLVLLAKAYGSKPGDPNWTPNSDIDNNDVVGLSDLVILATYYGQHYP